MATGIIQRLNLRNNKASLVDLESGIRYYFPRAEMDEPDTIKKHDVVTFTVSGNNAMNVVHRVRPKVGTVIKVIT